MSHPRESHDESPRQGDLLASRRPWAKLGWLGTLGPLAALVAIYVLFGLRVPTMFTPRALETMTQQTVRVGIPAVGMTLVILSGGIDLSTGSIIALGSVVTAMGLEQFGWPPLAAVGVGVLAGAACGLINGVLITRLKVVPFIVTLGMMSVVRGCAKGISDSQPINVAIEQTWLYELMAVLPPDRRWMLIPPGAWLMLLLALAAGLMIRYTRLGRHLVAVGSSEPTARLCGVAVERVKLFAYLAAGACSGLAGVMLVAYQSQGDPTGATGAELDIIAAVVIGGGSLAGGEGSVFGSLVGAMIIIVIQMGCQMLQLPPWVTQVLTGAIIVAAVALDRLRHGRKA